MAVGVAALFDGIGDFANAAGYVAEGSAYRKAEHFALQNATISQEAGDIKEAQASRQIYKVIGAQKAEYAGAGLTGGGSAQDVLRNSVSQGALEKAIINEQTQINVVGYESQAAQFSGMAFAADAAAVAAAAKGVGSIFSAFGLSDRRLKTDIAWAGKVGELNLYSFRFIGEDKVRIGPMADEVAVHYPEAMGPMIGGYATVDYGVLGLASLLEEGA